MSAGRVLRTPSGREIAHGDLVRALVTRAALEAVGRPSTITCSCGRLRTVPRTGPLPKRCGPCARAVALEAARASNERARALRPPTQPKAPPPLPELAQAPRLRQVALRGILGLREWMATRHPSEIAREMEVQLETVKAWLAGTTIPSSEMRRALRRLTSIPVRAWGPAGGSGGKREPRAAP